MHELGHNLGLQHGGGDGVNNKPNYLSVMNYSYWPSLTKGGAAIFDYSRAVLPAPLAPLNENGLSESAGIGAGAAGFSASHWCPATATAAAGFVTVADGSKPIDWNCNGVTTDNNVQFDVNNGSQRTNLSGFNDWVNIKFKGGLVGAGDSTSLPMDTPVDEITPEQAQQVLPVDTTPPVTTEAQAPPPNANGWNDTNVVVTLTATDDISGVARTEFDLDSAGLQVAPTPIVITAEGTIEFGQLRGPGEEYPLLAVDQEVRLRQGEAGTSFAAFWDVLHDETEIVEHLTTGTQHHEKHGLDLVQIRTDRGKLIVEE